MRSPADRRRVERVLRVVGLAALALWIANAARPRARRFDTAGGSSLAEALPRWTRASFDSLHVQLDTTPDPAHAAWLAALDHAGVGVSWSGSSVPPIAIETYAASDPEGGVFVLASAPLRASTILSDALGEIDTLSGGPLATRMTAVQPGVDVRSGNQHARADVAPASAPRRIYVTGTAGWEAKFIIAALEESGWTVDARLFVAPDKDVVQGGGARAGLDTGRHAAVVVLDSTSAERLRGLEAFVRAGGGAVLAGDANRAQRAANLVAWRAGRRENAPLGTLPGDTLWRGLSRIPFDTMSARRAITLEVRNGNPVVAARRHHAGRVIGIGYDETWRWRMSGGEAGHVAHREWWSRAVASVAMRFAVIPGEASGYPRERVLQFGSAPLASIHDQFGPPSPETPSLGASVPTTLLANVLGALCLMALLGEWFLRRSRGAR